MVEIQRLRQLRWTGAQIAEVVQVSRATVARTLSQLGMARPEGRAERPPLVRYEWAWPGQLVHLDIKKLGRIGRVGHRITGDRHGQARGIGWEFVHVCVDDCSRVAYAEVLNDETGPTVAAFLRRAVGWFRRRGGRVQRVLTDNGSGYRSFVFCRRRPRPAPGASAHPALYATDEWQGRAVHSHPAARVGLWPGLSEFRASDRGPRPLAVLLQLAPSPSRTRRPTAHQQTRLA